MKAIELNLDYFQIYNLIEPIPLVRRLRPEARICKLKDQFDEEPIKGIVEMLGKFADRVSKNEEPLYDKNAHLTIYRLKRPEPVVMRRVSVANQFNHEEPQEFYTREVLGLMVPARKRFARRAFTDETELDHYKIYRVVEAKPVETLVNLEDQFGRRETTVHHPVLFAVPVWKKREKEYPIINEEAHLTIYAVNGMELKPIVIDILDQFFPSKPLRLKMDISLLLAVPSKKLDWEKI